MRLRLAGGRHCFHFAVSKRGTEERSGADGMKGGGTEARRPFLITEKNDCALFVTTFCRRRINIGGEEEGETNGEGEGSDGARPLTSSAGAGNKYFVRFCEQE